MKQWPKPDRAGARRYSARQPWRLQCPLFSGIAKRYLASVRSDGILLESSTGRC